nr:venom carboxylesterase-6-like [Megalopta genalis]
MIGSCCTMSSKQFGKPGCGLWLIMAILFLVAASDLGAQSTRVHTKFGTIRGFWSRSTRGRLAAHYLGIPYAEPPTGDLRFRSPKPWSRNWNSTYDAIKDGNMCIQPTKDEKSIIGSEDCLYLNVFVPVLSEERRTKAKLPVVVFVHGGRYIFGSSNSHEMSPEYLMNENLVLVTLNYRLSIMGFFSTENSVAPGNYALKDIITALRWVQENIEVFHGDPKSVTLWGHSAGAGAAHILSLNKNTEGLFHRLILMSGNAYSPWNLHSKNKMRKNSLKVAKLLGCLPNGTHNGTEAIRIDEDPNFDRSKESIKREEQMVGCLRSLDQKAIISTMKNFKILDGVPCCPFGHVIEEKSEDAVISENPFIVIKKGQFRDIPCIIGITKDDGMVKTMVVKNNKDLRKKLTENFKELLPLLVEYQELVTDRHNFARAVRDFYLLTNDTEKDFQNLTNVVSDAIMIYPVYELLKHQSTLMKSSTFFYYFAYQGTYSTTFLSGTPIHYGVSHGDDLNYLLPFLNKRYKDYYGQQTSEDDTTMTNIMTEFWVSFATTGVPKAWKVPPWPDYKVEKKHLVIGNGTSLDITVGDDELLATRMAFWEEMNERYTNKLGDPEIPKEEVPKETTPSISFRNYSDLLMLLLTTIIAIA